MLSECPFQGISFRRSVARLAHFPIHYKSCLSTFRPGANIHPKLHRTSNLLRRTTEHKSSQRELQHTTPHLGYRKTLQSPSKRKFEIFATWSLDFFFWRIVGCVWRCTNKFVGCVVWDSNTKFPSHVESSLPFFSCVIGYTSDILQAHTCNITLVMVNPFKSQNRSPLLRCLSLLGKVYKQRSGSAYARVRATSVARRLSRKLACAIGYTMCASSRAWHWASTAPYDFWVAVNLKLSFLVMRIGSCWSQTYVHPCV